MKLLETIKCKDGKLYNLPYHQARFDLSRKKYFSLHNPVNLENEIRIPEVFQSGLYRCRVTYSKNIEKIEFFLHHFRKVESLKLIEDNKVDYRFKYADRKKIHELFDQRGTCDDILIVQNGCITDSFTANTVFYDGIKWWTPDTPLLPGTQRARLIAEGKISVCRISVSDLTRYEKVGLINAMLDLDAMPVIHAKHIFS